MTEIIPNVLLEQLPLVAAIMIVVFYTFNWIKQTRKEDQQYRREDQAFQDQQRKEWQNFMASRDDKWLAFNKEQRDCNNLAMNELRGSVQDLTTVTQGMVIEMKEMRSENSAFHNTFLNKFHDHDDQARDILELVANAKAKPRTRAPKVKEEDIC